MSQQKSAHVCTQMNTILGFKNLSEEDLEDNPCPVPLRDKMSEFHDGLMQVNSQCSLAVPEVRDRVTRLGEFLPIGRLFTLSSFLLTTEGAQTFGQLKLLY
jgi:hypothetical protein